PGPPALREAGVVVPRRRVLADRRRPGPGLPRREHPRLRARTGHEAARRRCDLFAEGTLRGTRTIADARCPSSETVTTYRPPRRGARSTTAPARARPRRPSS